MSLIIVKLARSRNNDFMNKAIILDSLTETITTDKHLKIVYKILALNLTEIDIPVTQKEWYFAKNNLKSANSVCRYSELKKKLAQSNKNMEH